MTDGDNDGLPGLEGVGELHTDAHGTEEVSKLEKHNLALSRNLVLVLGELHGAPTDHAGRAEREGRRLGSHTESI